MKHKWLAVDLAIAVPAADGLPSLSAAETAESESTVVDSATWEKEVSMVETLWYDNIGEQEVPLDEHPNPMLEREDWQNLNGLWEFQGSISSAAEPAAYTREILVPYPMESALSGIMQHYDYAWYRREVTVPADWEGRVLLHFEAVDWRCSVYVNGTEVVKDHEGGYEPFQVDITDLVSPGESYELKVKVFDNTGDTQSTGKQRTYPANIFYTACSGIWGTVWMEQVARDAYIDEIKLVPDVDAGAVKLTVYAANYSDGSAPTADLTIRAGDTVVSTATGLLTETEQAVAIPADQRYLWSPDDPFLYTVELTLSSGDTVKSYFGMRKVEVKEVRTGVMGFYLNDEHIYQIGTLDQGYWPESNLTAPTDEALRWDIQKQKDLGFNMVRKHIKVESRRWYYYADTLGLLVWQDKPSGEQVDYTRYTNETKQMVETLRNHPSIVMWVMYNEGWGQHDTDKTIELTNAIQELDPTRLVSCASGWNHVDAGHVRDNHSYPNPGMAASSTQLQVCGEFGGLQYVVPEHQWFPDAVWEGYTGDYGSVEALTEGYVEKMNLAIRLQDKDGLQAGVYTQFTDVEGEVNGLYTYDREVLKVERETVFAINQRFLGREDTLDTAGLTGAVRRVFLLDESLYTEDSWAAVTEAKEAAETLLRDGAGTQLAAYDAAQRLLCAIRRTGSARRSPDG